MPNPQQPELRRSSRGGTEDAAVKEAVTGRSVPPTKESAGPVPEDNVPGHHPDKEQDKPVGRFRRRAARVAEEAHEHEHDIREEEIAVGDLRFSALACGPESGEPVVLLHGFPQLSSAWRPQLRALGSLGYHVVAPDQRGYSPGARPGGVSSYRLTQMVADVLGMADRLGAHRFHLVGHDWGGAVAWATAASHPERLRSLTSVSTPHPRAFLASLLRSPQLLRSGYMPLFAVPFVPEIMFGAAGGLLLRRLLVSSGLPGDIARQYVDELRSRGAIGTALNWYRALPLFGAEVGDVEVPTLYVWSDRDVALGPEAARATADHVSGPYRFEVLHGVSHWIPETAPTKLNDLLAGHIDEAKADSAG